MKVKLTKPLPQIGRVIPAGVVIDDAPETLMEKLVRQGRAVWVDEIGPQDDPEPHLTAKPRGRRKVTDNG